MVLPSGPRAKAPAGKKGQETSEIRMPVTWSDSLGTRLIYRLMFLDNNNLRSPITLSLKKNRLFKTKTMKHDKLYFKLFPCFCFRLLWLWFVFLDSVSVLRFNFEFLSVFPVRGAYFRVGICVSVFW